MDTIEKAANRVYICRSKKCKFGDHKCALKQCNKELQNLWKEEKAHHKEIIQLMEQRIKKQKEELKTAKGFTKEMVEMNIELNQKRIAKTKKYLKAKSLEEFLDIYHQS